MTPASVSSRFPVARRAWFPATAAAALCLSAAGLRAQTATPPPGAPDPSFDAGAIGSTVYAVDYETDSGGAIKVAVGGDKAYGGYLNTGDSAHMQQPPGPADANFLFPAFGNAARIIFTIVPERTLADDSSLPNILIGGQFDGGFGRGTNNNKAAQNIIRLRPDGTLDTDFSTALGSGANNYVTALLPLKKDGQQDGQIVVGGLFTAVNHLPRRRVARLLNSGRVDPNFATGANIDNDVLALAESIDPNNPMQPDGYTLVGGTFNHVAGQPYGKLVRLDPNGNLDLSFHPNIDLRVLAILVQGDGNIIIGGDFTNINGTKVSHLARLKYDGSLDPTFVGGVSGVPNNDVNPTTVNVLKEVGGGYIYVGGEFSQINSMPRQYLGLIDANGNVYTGFDTKKYVYNAVQSIAVQSDGNVLVGETAGPRINNKFPPSLVRLIGPGASFVPVQPFDTAQIARRSVQPNAATPSAAQPVKSVSHQSPVDDRR